MCSGRRPNSSISHMPAKRSSSLPVLSRSASCFPSHFRRLNSLTGRHPSFSNNPESVTRPCSALLESRRRSTLRLLEGICRNRCASPSSPIFCFSAEENAQTMNSLGANGNSFNKNWNGPSDAIAFPNIYQLFGSQAATKVAQIQGNLSAWATSQAASALSADALHQIYQVQADLIINKNVRPSFCGTQR